jgi:hypothetical protein
MNLHHHNPDGDMAASSPEAAHAATEVQGDEPPTPVDWMASWFWPAYALVVTLIGVAVWNLF